MHEVPDHHRANGCVAVEKADARSGPGESYAPEKANAPELGLNNKIPTNAQF
jgi:hypothetical protein